MTSGEKSGEKTVVCFRMPAPGMRPGQPNGYLPRARALAQRAEALGATLAAWSAVTVAFAFDPDSLEEAVDLVASVVGEPVLDVERWACGIARGVMEPLMTSGGARGDLAWGEALVMALTLSRVARAGEVLVHASVDDDESLRLYDARVANDGGLEVRGSRLDAQNPWRRRPSVTKLQAFVMPDGAPTVPKLPDPSPPPPVVAKPLPRPVPPPLPPPAPAAARVARSSTTSEVVPYETPRPQPVPTEVAVRESRAAFLARDRVALERWAADFDGMTGSFSSRMRAFLDLSRGDTGRALRILESSRDRAQGSARCQAALALAVALAGMGNLDDALLEGLDALANARTLSNPRAEAACSRFLERLTAGRLPMAEAALIDEDSVDIDLEDFEV